MDLSHQAVKSCIDLSKSRNLGHLTFFQGDLTSKESIQKTVDHAREKAGKKDIVFYSRFVIHSIDDEQELMFLEILSNCLRPDELVYFEFRSKEDSELIKHYVGHFRRYIDTDSFSQQLVQELGFEIEYSITGKGMAKFKEEDPFVSRVIARKK